MLKDTCNIENLFFSPWNSNSITSSFTVANLSTKLQTWVNLKFYYYFEALSYKYNELWVKSIINISYATLLRSLRNTPSHYVKQFEHDNIQHLLYNKQVTNANNVISANLNGVLSFWSNVRDLSHGTRWQWNVMLNQAVLKYSLPSHSSASTEQPYEHFTKQ